MKILFSILLLSISTTMVSAQIFNRVLNRTKDKIGQKIEDKVVERISEEIAQAATKPIDDAVDSMLKERYEQDSIAGNTDVDYGEFLNAFLTPVELPPSYNFDLTLDAEVTDYDGEKQDIEMLLTSTGAAIGIVQTEDGKRMTMVFDMENEIMAIYNDGEDKTVQALPSMMSLATQMAAKEVEDSAYEMTIEKTGKTKKIEGYECDEWKIDDEDTVTKAYVASDFPVKWEDAYKPFLRQMLPTTQRDKMPSGMTLKSETKTKKKNKKSKFEVKKVITDTKVIDNSEYKKEDFTPEK